MSDDSVLTQDEVDALLNAVDTDDAEVDQGDAPSDPASLQDDVRAYDLVEGDRVVRGQFPILGIINQKISQGFRNLLSKYIYSEVRVTPNGVDIIRYSEYIHSLYVPTSIHVVNLPPLTGEAMIVMDAKFIYEIVSQIFGGGRQRTKIEGRDFSVTENRIISRLFEFISQSMGECWAPILPISVAQRGYEVNPSLVSLVRANEVVIVSSFDIDFDSGRGTVHIVMPHQMLEPHHDVIEDSVNGGEVADPQWSKKLQQQLLDAEVPLTCQVARSVVTMADVLNMKSGDFLPLDVPPVHTVSAEGMPVFRARLGNANGNIALEYEEDCLAG